MDFVSAGIVSGKMACKMCTLEPGMSMRAEINYSRQEVQREEGLWALVQTLLGVGGEVGEGS